MGLPQKLLTASADGDLVTVKELVEEIGLRTRTHPRWCKDVNGRTSLHLAALNGHLDIVRYLVEESSCDVKCRDNNGNTPLNEAAFGGTLDIVRYLIREQGYEPMFEVTPLYQACAGGCLNVVKYLIDDQKVDPSCRDENGATPLHRAAEFGTLEVVKYLIEEKGCDVMCRNKYGNILLHMAAYGGKLDTVQYLITEQGCDPMCRGEYGRTSLHAACKEGHLNVVKYLISDQKVDPSCCDEAGATPLHIAAQFGTLEVVKYLIEEKGCDVMHRNKEGNTPLHVAALGGKLDTVKYLVTEQGCDPMCRGQYGTTPLHQTCSKGHLDVVDYLIDDQKVDPSCRDEDGFTPLHTASANAQLSVVKVLVEDYLCDPGLRDNLRRTPLNIAVQCHELGDTVSYLSDIQDKASTDLRRALVACLKPYIRMVHPTGQKLEGGRYGSMRILKSADELVIGKVFKTLADVPMGVVLKLCGEMILMMQVHHPNIVEGRGVCFLVDHPLPVLLMERLMSSLHAYLLDPSHHAVELTSKVSILCDVASGLSYLHSHTLAIIHRDLTAKNVLLDSNLKAKIGDFGNARLMDLDPECSPETFTSLPGTLEYMPPEAQGKHTRYDPSLDVFSFGHLALFTLIQSHVELLPPTYSDSEGIHAHSEVKRREESINTATQMLGAKHSLVVLIKSCLHNIPAQRPHTEQIVSRLQQAPRVAEEPKRLRLSEGDCAPDMRPVGSGVRGSEVDQPQLASSSQESDPTPPTPSAGEPKRDHTSSTHPLDAKPTIKQLLTLSTKSGRRIDIKTTLAADWKTFGYFLEFDEDGQALDLIEKECGRTDPEACYQQMMRKWRRGSGEQPASWRTLVRLLREFGEDVLAKDIEDALAHH